MKTLLLAADQSKKAKQTDERAMSEDIPSDFHASAIRCVDVPKHRRVEMLTCRRFETSIVLQHMKIQNIEN